MRLPPIHELRDFLEYDVITSRNLVEVIDELFMFLQLELNRVEVFADNAYVESTMDLRACRYSA